MPSIFDAVQHLYDGDKSRWRFVLCGSSARKLRRMGVNLLPGRSFYHRMLPLTLTEHPADEPLVHHAVSPLPFAWNKGEPHNDPFPATDLLTRLTFGELPGVVAAPQADRAELLRSFAFVHLEEEVRREALVKDWGAFVRFMHLAAAESGQMVNFAAISQESGVSQPTVSRFENAVRPRALYALGEALTVLVEPFKTPNLKLDGIKQVFYGLCVALIVIFQRRGVWPFLSRRLGFDSRRTGES